MSTNYIAYLPALRGEHCDFVTNIQTCKCAILKLGLLRFDLSHKYLYALRIFFLWNMKFRTIQGDCWLYSYTRSTGKCDIVQILLLLLDSYHWFFMLLIILFSWYISLQHKNIDQQYLVIISLCWSQASEPRVDLRDQIIVIREVGV